jgi:hypothetical protein
MHIRSDLLAIALSLGAIACGTDSPSLVSPEPLPPLEAQTWHVHSAGGQPMPALVAQRPVGEEIEWTFADSGRLVIAADGRWEQQLFLESFLVSEPAGQATRLDAGDWTVTDTGYLFTSDAQGARFVVARADVDSLTLGLQADGVPGTIAAVLRRGPPPATPAGVWSASALDDQPLPARSHLFDPYVEDGQEISVHFIVDSARFTLYVNGTYAHRIWATEWGGEAGGPPQVMRARWNLGDHGEWHRSGALMQLDSWYLQNHSMSGEFGADVLRMQHGLTHGDTPLPFRYVR